MELVKLLEKKDKLKFLKFREELYRGDPNYFATEEFTLKSILFEENPSFQKRIKCVAVQAVEGEKVFAQCVIFSDKRGNRVSVGFFDAIENAEKGVKLLTDLAKEMKFNEKTQVVVGLNGHLSYGVGILSKGFSIPNSFDSLYNKSYYKDYFKDFEKVGLSTYRGTFDLVCQKFIPFQTEKIVIRRAKINDFEKEMELMRDLCDQTIGKTRLYERTEQGHFFELTKDLKPFLKDENLLFAEKDGKTVGFLFWHPDFNQMLKGGRSLSILSIGLSYVFKRKKIKTVKLNAIGALSPYATYALLSEFFNLNKGKFKEVETNFIWDDNLRSAKIAHRIFGKSERKYEVYYIK